MTYPYDSAKIAFWLEQASYFTGMIQTELRRKNTPYYLLRIREAVCSSQIEGYECSVPELLQADLKAQSHPKISEVINPDVYITLRCFNALNTIEKICTPENPEGITKNTFLDLHQELFRNDDQISGGRYRENEVQVGTYHPPKHYQIENLMQELIEYIQSSKDPFLVKAGIVHAQFENIHPFIDGNGRTGRMLLSILTGINQLNSSSSFTHVWSSNHFYNKRQQYYAALRSTNETTKKVDFTEFLDYFLYSVVNGISMNLHVLKDARKRLQKERNKIQNQDLLESLAQNPIISENQAQKFGMDHIAYLTERKILKFLPDQKTYIHPKYLDIFSLDLDPS